VNLLHILCVAGVTLSVVVLCNDYKMRWDKVVSDACYMCFVLLVSVLEPLCSAC